MAIKSFKPYTPSRRNMTVSAFDGVDKKAKPERSLLEPLKKSSGRNSYGRITVRHRGGGCKRKYRIIDFRRDKLDMPAVVQRLEYAPSLRLRSRLHYLRFGRENGLSGCCPVAGPSIRSGGTSPAMSFSSARASNECRTDLHPGRDVTPQHPSFLAGDRPE